MSEADGGAPAPDPRAAPPLATPTAIAVRFGILGGGLASVLLAGPAIIGAEPGRYADFAGFTVAMVAVYVGSRTIAIARPRASYRERILAGTTLVAIASALVALALGALYAWLRPTLLAERYARYQAQLQGGEGAAGRSAEALARLAAQKAQFLDPAWQALGTAGTLFFFGMLLALYAAWRWRVAQRLAAARRLSR